MPNNNMERFTHRARRVLTLAEESAAQLKQPVIGTEHVLLGLMREHYGLASRVLKDLGLEQKHVIELIVELTPNAETSQANHAPELSTETKQVLELAVEDARLLEQRYIGTEHLLLGLVRQEDSLAVRILKRFDISPEQVQQQTKRVLENDSLPKQESAEAMESITRESEESQPTAFPATGSPHMTMAIVGKVLEMVSENKLTSGQASELLRALQLDMTLTASGKANFASMINRTGIDVKRRVRVTISDTGTKQTMFEIVNSLDKMLGFIDHFLKLVADNDFESLVFDGDSSPIATELRIEKDESSE